MAVAPVDEDRRLEQKDAPNMTTPENPDYQAEETVAQTPTDSAEAATAPLGVEAPVATAPVTTAPVAAAGPADDNKKKWLIGGSVAAGVAMLLIGFGLGYMTGDQLGNDGRGDHSYSRDAGDRGGPGMWGQDGRGGPPGMDGQQGGRGRQDCQQPPAETTTTS